MDIKEILRENAEKVEIKITKEQCEKFQIYFDLLIEWNSKINLTTITEPLEVVVKHFVDSLLLLKVVDIDFGTRLIDVGTGAGFPGIPLKIMKPQLELTLLDGLNKRLVFLKEVMNKLELDARYVHKRAEESGKVPDMREQYHIATARAVAKMSTLCELCMPLVKKDGMFIAMKGPGFNEELKQANKAVAILGGNTPLVKSFTLPGEDMGERNLVLIKKTGETPTQYPRHGNKIAKSPL